MSSGAAALRSHRGSISCRSSCDYRGMLLLTFIITLACLVTAIGLTSSCAAYFAQQTKFSYKKLVIGFALFSMLVSNLGLTEIIKIFLPALTSIYPPFIVLIMAAIVSGKNARPVGGLPSLRTDFSGDWMHAEFCTCSSDASFL